MRVFVLAAVAVALATAVLLDVADAECLGSTPCFGHGTCVGGTTCDCDPGTALFFFFFFFVVIMILFAYESGYVFVVSRAFKMGKFFAHGCWSLVCGGGWGRGEAREVGRRCERVGAMA